MRLMEMKGTEEISHLSPYSTTPCGVSTFMRLARNQPRTKKDLVNDLKAHKNKQLVKQGAIKALCSAYKAKEIPSAVLHKTSE